MGNRNEIDMEEEYGRETKGKIKGIGLPRGHPLTLKKYTGPFSVYN